VEKISEAAQTAI